jgi:hypothetical protein
LQRGFPFMPASAWRRAAPMSPSVVSGSDPALEPPDQFGSLVLVEQAADRRVGQPIAQVPRHVVFLDRLRDRALLVRSVIAEANELGWRPADVVDGPGVELLLSRVAWPSRQPL